MTAPLHLRPLLLSFCLTAALPALAQQADSLRMDSLIHALPEVMVRGERPVVRVEPGRLVYDLQRLMEGRPADNVFEALQELPGVTLQEGKLMLGALSATVVIDGKVSTMSAEQLATLLHSLPASRVARVEVMYNAPAKMQVRGAVINVVLRHDHADGAPLQGELNAGWQQLHDAEYGERATLLYSRGKISVDAMYKHSHGRSYTTTEEQSVHTLDDGRTHTLDTRQVHRSHGHGHDYRLGIDLNMAADHQLSLVYTGSYANHANRQDIMGSIVGGTDIASSSQLHNVRMDYRAPFGLKAGVEATWYHNPETQCLDSRMPTGMLAYLVDNDQRVNRWKAFLARERTFGHGWSINYGAHYTASANRSRQEYRPAAGYAATLPPPGYTRQHEDDVRLYAGFGKTFSPRLSLETSVEAEYYHSPAWHQWHLYPTFSLTYQPAEGHYLQLGLSTDRRYPDYWTMTNFTTYSHGGYNEVTGNPLLRPSTSYNLQAVYVLRGRYQLVAWFKHTDDYFTQTPYQRHDRLTVSYRYLNFDYQQQGGLQASAPLKVGRWLSSRLTLIGVWMRDKNSAFYDIPFDRSVAYAMANMRNTIVLSAQPDVTLSVDGMIRSRAIQATYDLPASGSLDLSARWQLPGGRAVVRAYCNDLLRTGSVNPVIDFRGQHLRMRFACYREVGLSLTYKFGAYRERRREEVDRDRF